MDDVPPGSSAGRSPGIFLMHEQKNGKRILRPLLIAAANVGILAVLLLATEVVLRLAGIPFSGTFVPRENAVARFDPELGWSYAPHSAVKFSNGDRTWTVSTDGNGIRVPFPDVVLSPDAASVLFIGDAATMGDALPYDESFVGQFASLVGPALQTVNLGVQGYGTDQALLALRRFAPRFNTRVVVYTFSGDQIAANGNYDRRFLFPDAQILGTKPLFAFGRGGGVSLARPPRRTSEYRNSYLYDLFRMGLEDRLGTGPPYPVDLTRALIRAMRDYCSERNSAFLLVNWRWRESDFNDLADLGVDIVDTLEHAPGGWEDMTVPGEGLPDAAAGRQVARMLIRHFREKGLLARTDGAHPRRTPGTAEE